MRICGLTGFADLDAIERSWTLRKFELLRDFYDEEGPPAGVTLAAVYLKRRKRGKTERVDMKSEEGMRTLIRDMQSMGGMRLQ